MIKKRRKKGRPFHEQLNKDRVQSFGGLKFSDRPWIHDPPNCPFMMPIAKLPIAIEFSYPPWGLKSNSDASTLLLFWRYLKNWSFLVLIMVFSFFSLKLWHNIAFSVILFNILRPVLLLYYINTIIIFFISIIFSYYY